MKTILMRFGFITIAPAENVESMRVVNLLFLTILTFISLKDMEFINEIFVRY